MRERPQRRDVGKVRMSAAARQPFDVLQAHLIELAEQRSVSHHGLTFLLEVLLRNNQIGLLLAIYFNEIDDASGITDDASQWRIIVNSLYEGGVYVPIDSEPDIEKVLQMIRQAREVSRA